MHKPLILSIDCIITIAVIFMRSLEDKYNTQHKLLVRNLLQQFQTSPPRSNLRDQAVN